MQFDFGIFNGNLIDITFGIKIIIRIKTLNKIFKGVKVIGYFLFIDFRSIVFIDTISIKDINGWLVDSH